MKKAIIKLVETLQVGDTLTLTQRLASTPDITFTQKDGYAERVFETTIHHIEECSTYYYIGHTPKDQRNGKFGYFKVFKNKSKSYGVVAINNIFG